MLEHTKNYQSCCQTDKQECIKEVNTVLSEEMSRPFKEYTDQFVPETVETQETSEKNSQTYQKETYEDCHPSLSSCYFARKKQNTQETDCYYGQDSYNGRHQSGKELYEKHPKHPQTQSQQKTDSDAIVNIEKIPFFPKVRSIHKFIFGSLIKRSTESP